MLVESPAQAFPCLKACSNSKRTHDNQRSHMLTVAVIQMKLERIEVVRRYMITWASRIETLAVKVQVPQQQAKARATPALGMSPTRTTAQHPPGRFRVPAFSVSEF